MKPFILVMALLIVTGCSNDTHVDEHAHEREGEAAFERGPHNGRLLEQDNFAVEVTIFEAGVPPEFRVYLYEDDKPLPPTAASVRIS